MNDFYYINARGSIIQIPKMHPIFYIEDSFIQCALKYDTFSSVEPFYIDIDPTSFHTILTYLNCQQEANSEIDNKAQKYLKLLENEIETNPILLFSMNKLAILDDMAHKTEWNCSFDKHLDKTQQWDEISGFTYILNMLCEKKYKDKYSCINKLGKDETGNTVFRKNIPILDIYIYKMNTSNTNNNVINLQLGYQYSLNDYLVKKIKIDKLYDYIEKFENIADFSDLFKDIKNLMPGCKNVFQRYI